ncbi:hypothetical protein GCM10010219_31700 [Streptomyces netropsis]|nr:hypothetical protein GCM10010219_31700 [Streptomyces netropsis]
MAVRRPKAAERRGATRVRRATKERGADQKGTRATTACGEERQPDAPHDPGNRPIPLGPVDYRPVVDNLVTPASQAPAPRTARHAPATAPQPPRNHLAHAPHAPTAA